jgi:putative phosphoesterase
MRVGIVSDIHCNVAGLQAALDLMGGVDELICAGDAIYQFRFSNEVTALLRERGARVILGNHEETFYSRDGERARAAPHNDRALLDWLAAQPQEIDTQVNGRRLFVVHGSPWEPRKDYIYPTSGLLHRFDGFDADYVVLGHTHYQMARRFGRTLVINPGSAGEPRDQRNGWRLSFAVLDTASGEVRFCNYDDPTRPHIAPGFAPAAPTWTDTSATAP